MRPILQPIYSISKKYYIFGTDFVTKKLVANSNTLTQSFPNQNPFLCYSSSFLPIFSQPLPHPQHSPTPKPPPSQCHRCRNATAAISTILVLSFPLLVSFFFFFNFQIWFFFNNGDLGVVRLLFLFSSLIFFIWVFVFLNWLRYLGLIFYVIGCLREFIIVRGSCFNWNLV